MHKQVVGADAIEDGAAAGSAADADVGADAKTAAADAKIPAADLP